MRQVGNLGERPRPRQIAIEATQALVRLDAARLEELALSCQVLNRDIVELSPAERAGLSRDAQDAVGDMALFARVLEVTRSNLTVMNRLRELREGRAEYSEAQVRGWVRAEGRHGNH